MLYPLLGRKTGGGVQWGRGGRTGLDGFFLWKRGQFFSSAGSPPLENSTGPKIARIKWLTSFHACFSLDFFPIANVFFPGDRPPTFSDCSTMKGPPGGFFGIFFWAAHSSFLSSMAIVGFCTKAIVHLFHHYIHNLVGVCTSICSANLKTHTHFQHRFSSDHAVYSPDRMK